MSDSPPPASFLRLLDEYQKAIEAARPHESVMQSIEQQLDLLKSSHPHLSEVLAQLGTSKARVSQASDYWQALRTEQGKVPKANPAMSEILAREEAIRKQTSPEVNAWKLQNGGGQPDARDAADGPSPLASQPQDPNRGPQKIVAVTDLGRVIRDKRKAMGLTQQQFADITGVGRRFISELESGKPTLEIGRVLKVCQSVGVELTVAVR